MRLQEEERNKEMVEQAKKKLKQELVGRGEADESTHVGKAAEVKGNQEEKTQSNDQ